MAWLLAGLFVGPCVHLSHIARKIHGPSQKLNKVKMLSRLLKNQHIQVRPWFEPVTRDLLATAVNHGQTVRLLVDGTKVGNGHQLLMVALAYRRRAIPIAWTWVKGNRGHSSARKQCALLAYVSSLMPANARVEIAGDSEFGAIDVLRLLDQWDWGYALRQNGSHLVCPTGQSMWKRCDSLVTRPGDACWLDSVRLTQKHADPTRFLAIWQKGESEPWLLATNLDMLDRCLANREPILIRTSPYYDKVYGGWICHNRYLQYRNTSPQLVDNDISLVRCKPDANRRCDRRYDRRTQDGILVRFKSERLSVSR